MSMVVRQVRNWLVQEGQEVKLNRPSPNQIWYDFNDFMGNLFDILTAKKWKKNDINNLPVTELLEYMRKWIKEKNEKQ